MTEFILCYAFYGSIFFFDKVAQILRTLAVQQKKKSDSVFKLRLSWRNDSCKLTCNRMGFQ